MTNYLQVHGGNIYEEARRLGVISKSVLDASASLVPFPLPKTLQKCLQNALATNCLRNYPDRSHFDLRRSIGKCHNVNPEMVLPGNGAAELFTWAAREASISGLNCLPSPGFSDYERALRCWNADYIHVSLPLKWSKEIPQVFPLRPQGNVLWITNPHNPTGHLWSKESIKELLNDYKLVICDEAFLPLVPNGEDQSVIPLIENHRNLIVIRSLTKLFGIAGLRLGYAISTSNRLSQWQRWRDPWPLNSLAIEAGCTIMNDQKLLQGWTSKIHSWVKKEGAWFRSHLKNIKGISSHPSSTNFFLIESQKSLIPLRKELEKEHILLRDCRSFKYLNEQWLRISLQERINNQRIINSINRILKESPLKP